MKGHLAIKFRAFFILRDRLFHGPDRGFRVMRRQSRQTERPQRNPHLPVIQVHIIRQTDFRKAVVGDKAVVMNDLVQADVAANADGRARGGKPQAENEKLRF